MSSTSRAKLYSDGFPALSLFQFAATTQTSANVAKIVGSLTRKRYLALGLNNMEANSANCCRQNGQTCAMSGAS